MSSTGSLPARCSLERALRTVVDLFHQHSARRDHLDRLSLAEFETLLREQAPSFLSVCDRNQPGYLKRLFEETDLNRDKELTFDEFATVLAKLADDAHRVSHGSERCGPDRD